MGTGMSGLGGFVQGFAKGYGFMTDERKKAQEAEAREMELEAQRGVQEAMKQMPNMETFRRPVYKEGMAPSPDFQGPPTEEQVEGWVHDSYAYSEALRKAADNIKDPTKRQVFKTAGMQPLFDEAQRYGKQALLYKRSNQTEAAYKALQRAYAYMPDGQDIELIRSEDGTVGAMRIRDREGNIVQDHAPLFNDEDFMLAATVALDPKAFFEVYNNMERNNLYRANMKQDADQFAAAQKARQDEWDRLDAREKDQFKQRMELEYGKFGLSLAELNMTAQDRAAAQAAAERNAAQWTPADFRGEIGAGMDVLKEWFKMNPKAAQMGETQGANSLAESAAIMEGLLLLNGPPRRDPKTGQLIGMSAKTAAALALMPVDTTKELLGTMGLRVEKAKPKPGSEGGVEQVIFKVNGRPVLMPPELTKYMNVEKMLTEQEARAQEVGAAAQAGAAAAQAGAGPGAAPGPVQNEPRGLGAVIDVQRQKQPPWRNWGAQNPPEAGMGELVTGSAAVSTGGAPQAGMAGPAPAPAQAAPAPAPAPAQAGMAGPPQPAPAQLTNMDPQNPPPQGQVMRLTAKNAEEAKKLVQKYTQQGIPVVVTVAPKGSR